MSPLANVERRLHEIGTTTIDAAGNGTIVIGPAPPSTYWELDEIRVLLPGGTGSARVNHGPASSPVMLDTTRHASDNRTAPPRVTLYPGEVLTTTFSLATPGVRAQVTARGFQKRFP